MKCPKCHYRQIWVYPAGGFTSKESPIKECPGCEQVWRIVPGKNGTNRTDIIQEGKDITFPEEESHD